MPRKTKRSSLWWLAGPLLVTLACSHDSPRDNPLDPTLTPPVELQVAMDDTAGTATLTWTRYEGEQPFAAYWVLRNIFESTGVDTLERISDQSREAYTDTTLDPNTDYVYRVSVATGEGFEQPSDEQRIDGYVTRTVELLQPQSHPETGTIGLSWTQYRDPGFESYEVHRRAVGTDQDSVLVAITDVHDTAFADVGPLHGVNYLYRVAVAAAGQELTSNSVDGQLSLPAVTITEAQFTSRTASCSLAWTPYAGPRLQSYRVLRSTASLIPQVVAEIADRRVTSFVDTGLVGETEHHYQVGVVTTRGEEVTSQSVSGAIHWSVAEWPLELDEGGYVRLYVAPDGRIAASVADPYRVRLLFLDTAGELLDEQTLVEVPHPVFLPQSVSVVLDGEGTLLSLGVRFSHLSPALRLSHIPGHLSVLRFDINGCPITQEHTLFADSLAALPDEAVRIASSIQLGGVNGVFVDEVRVTAGTDLLFEDDFGDGDLSGWPGLESRPVINGTVYWDRAYWVGALSRSEGTWERLLFQADVGFYDGAIKMVAGTTAPPGESLLSLHVEHSGDSFLRWAFRPPPGSELRSSVRDFSEPLSFTLIPGFVNRISLGVADNRPQATIATPSSIWHDTWDDPAPWVSLARGEEKVLLTAGHMSNLIVPGSEDPASAALETPISAIRLWQSGGRPHMGVCKPETQRIVANETGIPGSGALMDYHFNRERSATLIGGNAGQGAGELLFPLSFDAGPDGRIFVLDAGNSRIQVFDPAGNYITQWGKRGDGKGEFDFGHGSVPKDFAGSICVDDEGYIYVADVGNGRIRRFSP